MFLLDTNVISEIFKSRPHPNLLDWYQNQPEHSLYLSVLTLGEIRKGIEKTHRNGNDKKAAYLRDVLTTLECDFAEHILPITTTITQEWGKMILDNPNHPVDTFLAATAHCHALTLMTRNVKDVANLPISALNPFAP